MTQKSKIWALLIAAAMLLTMLPSIAFAAADPSKGYEDADLPAAPVVNDDVWTVTPENAQYTLDGAYGSIDGKTIHFSAGSYSETLILARATKYTGSNTIYYNMTWTQETGWQMDAEPVDLEALDSPSIKTYMRTIENVTFTADEGVILPGFTASSGHVYQNAYDYVREVAVPNSNNSYYMHSSMKNILFDGLTIQNQIVINDYSAHAANSGIHFQNCTFMGNESNMTTGTYGAIRMMADSKYFENITISDCSFTNYFQGIYLQGPSNVQIKNNVINNTTHNAIALQSSAKNPIQGDVVIAENIIKNAHDRAIRMGSADQVTSVTVINNVMIASGDSDGQLIKAQSLPEEPDKISLEHNYWDGKEASVAVGNESIIPTNTGIIGGTFKEEISQEYCAEGYAPVTNNNGEYVVCNHSNTEIRNAKEATCNEKGYTGDAYCKDCGTLLETGAEIEATGQHTDADNNGKCDVCGHDMNADNPAPTGDQHSALWFALALFAAASFTVVSFYNKKKICIK